MMEFLLGVMVGIIVCIFAIAGVVAWHEMGED